jgi:hypothetical protein
MPELELDVAGEPWTGLVVVADKRDFPWPDATGHYGLVQAVEWCMTRDEVTVWRGPRKRDQIVAKNKLIEVTCRSVQVDKRGFYACVPDPGAHRMVPCGQITEELDAEIEAAAETFLNARADEQAAETTSYVDYEEAYQKLWEDPDIIAIATFGDAVAVNGELRLEGLARPPRPGWELTEFGGRHLDGGEAEIEKEHVSEVIASSLTDKLKMRVDPWIVRRVLDTHFGRQENEYIMRGSSRGHTEVWISPRLMRKYEEAQEAAERSRAARERLRWKAEHEQRESERRREILERQAKVKRGGFPEPHDWSPQGQLPWEV